MIDKVRKTIDKHNMLLQGDRVLVGVSGGADSIALISILLDLKAEYGIELGVAHIEHGIRGEESLADAQFVENFCNNRGVEFHKLSINAIQEAKACGQSVEEYSRNKRYQFFSSLGFDKIATAHNLSDNTETLIHRLARGTGLKGACAIPPVRDNIIRPLIDIPSDEIREYCRENSIDYRVDSTNLDDEYTRNLIRNEILPLFKKINPSFDSAINKFINIVNEDYEFIRESTDSAYSSAITQNGLSIDVLKKLERPVLKRVIIRYFGDFGIELDAIHLEQILNLISKPSKIQIKGNIFAVANKNYLRFADLSSSEFNGKYVTRILNIDEFNKTDIDFYCDCDKINGEIFVRKRLPEDTIIPANRNRTKKIKKLFNELAVPLEKRESIGIVCDEKGVIGVMGYCAHERVKLDRHTERVMIVNYSPEDK